MKNRRFLLFMITTIFLTGCWDNVEIQDRGYVLGIAIDKAIPIPKGQEPEKEYLSERDLEEMPHQKGEPKYSYTIQLPILARAKNKPAGAGSGGGEEAITWDLAIQANSFMEANRELSTRMDFPPFYEHLQVIILSEDVAKKGVSDVLDLFLRDHEMRRRTRLFIAPGEAKKILDVQPRISDFASVYLSNLPLNADKTSRILHLTDLGKVSKNIHIKEDFVLPRVIATKDEIKDAGSAVFKRDRMVGWLGEIDTIYLKWIRNAVKGGVIVVELPKQDEGLATLEVTKAKTKVTPIFDDGEINVKIDVEATFNLAEKTQGHYKVALDESFIDELEKRAEEDMKKKIISTIKYVQKEFETDIFHFSVAVKKKDLRKWLEIKDEWDEIFKKIEPIVSVKAEIKHIGTMK